MSKLIPDYVFESIYDITPALLQQHGVRGVLIDLDGTLASRKAALPSDTLAPFVRALHEAGLRVLVFSNNGASRVGRFCDALGVDYMSRAVKPLSFGFRRAAKRLGLRPDLYRCAGRQQCRRADLLRADARPAAFLGEYPLPLRASVH